MSTRMMLVIQENKELKVASYGHYDGYPTSDGMNIFKTLKSININDFKMKIKQCSFYSQEEADIFKKELDKRASEVTIEPPESILQSATTMIEFIINQDSSEEIKTLNYIDYAESCNYLYFINFDKNSYSIYYRSYDKECEKCLKIGNIRYTNFERIAKFKLSKLPNLNEYMDKLKKH